MKKVGAWLGLAIILVAGSTASVLANSLPIWGIVNQWEEANEFIGSPVSMRFFREGFQEINPAGEFACEGVNRVWIAEGRHCEIAWRAKPAKDRYGYVSYAEDVLNIGGYGVIQMAWDAEARPGERTHAGYYGWVARLTERNQTSNIWEGDCLGSGNSPASCLGSVNPGTAEGTTVEGAAQGTLEAVGGLRPIPVPLVVGEDPAGEVLHLDWIDASVIGNESVGTMRYNLYYVARDPGPDGTPDCSEPFAHDYSFLKTYEGSEAAVDIARDLGLGGELDGTALFFAVRLLYPVDSVEVTSRYLSANSACHVIETEALTMGEFAARYLDRNTFEVSWSTEKERGVVGFHLARSYYEDGPFTRVGEMIPAHGEPSSYVTLDRIFVRPPLDSEGIFYRLEAESENGEITLVDPVEVPLEMPAHITVQPK